MHRYDARGYLNNVEEHEPKPGAVAAYMASLSEEERALEDLCEEERFLALFRDLHEESILHGEGLPVFRATLLRDGLVGTTVPRFPPDDVEKVLCCCLPRPWRRHSCGSKCYGPLFSCSSVSNLTRKLGQPAVRAWRRRRCSHWLFFLKLCERVANGML